LQYVAATGLGYMSTQYKQYPMKTIFDKATRDELASRINTLGEQSTAQWGKMNVSQMVKHCAQFDEMALGKTKYKQSLLGKLFGKVALKDVMKNQPMKKNLPTVPSFVIRETGNLAEEKKKWLALLDEYDHFNNDGFIHPFFGTMTRENTGHIAYKHADHHLRQFNS
jgi:predicted P-loop ATPase